MNLLDFLFPPRSDEALVRGVSTDDFLTRLTPRLVPETRPGTVTLFSFGDPLVRATVHEAKYHGSSHAFELLAAALADYLREADDVRKPVIVPIPLGAARKKERGFNQVEEVACRALRSLGEGWGGATVDTTLLERTRETASQVSLPRHEREENMRGAFTTTLKLRGTSPAEIAQHTYIVLDDVVTTGATLQAAIDALRDAGIEHIIPLALAH